MFKPVSPKLNVTSMEENVLKFWKQTNIFQKTVEQRQGAPEYVFYEVPQLPMESLACIMCWRARLRICFRAIRSCAVIMFRGAVAGIRTACQSRSKWRSN